MYSQYVMHYKEDMLKEAMHVKHKYHVFIDTDIRGWSIYIHMLTSKCMINEIYVFCHKMRLLLL